MPPLPETIKLVLASFAPLFTHRVWLHAQVLLVGAILAPGGRTVTAVLRAMGLAAERHFTHDHRVLNRVASSARQGSRMLFGLLLTLLVPPAATIELGADDTIERRGGCKIKVKGYHRDAVRSSKTHVIRCFGLKWVPMTLWVRVPWSRPVWAWPVLTAWCWPAETSQRRRHNTSVDGVRKMMTQGRSWLARRRLVLIVDGGFAAVLLALACVTHHVTMVLRWRYSVVLYDPLGPQPPGKCGPKPLNGTRQRRLQGWAERSDTPWEIVELGWYGGKRKQLWGFSHTALWDHPEVAPGGHPLRRGSGPGGKAAHGGPFLYGSGGHAWSDLAMGHDALGGGGNL